MAKSYELIILLPVIESCQKRAASDRTTCNLIPLHRQALAFAPLFAQCKISGVLSGFK